MATMHAPAIERSADASGIDSALINEWQRGLPLVSRPFATIALAMFALAALTRIRWLFWVATASGLTGLAYGFAAYTGMRAIFP